MNEKTRDGEVVGECIYLYTEEFRVQAIVMDGG